MTDTFAVARPQSVYLWTATNENRVYVMENGVTVGYFEGETYTEI